MAAANTHTVVWGDTLSELAVKYNTTTYQLQVLNGIKDPDKIYVGQVLKLVPGQTVVTPNKTTSTNKVNINHFGLQAGTDTTIYAKWEWSKDNTDSYQVEWSYFAGDLWFMGNDSTIAIKDATYSHPSNATRVRIRVKPISKTHVVNEKETHYWTAEWSDYKVYDVNDTPPAAPETPSFKIDGYKLTAELNNINEDIHSVEFFVIKKNTTLPCYRASCDVKNGYSSFTTTLNAGYEYTLRARYKKNGIYSEWSKYSDYFSVAPASVGSFVLCQAASETSVRLVWEASSGATKYVIEYATKRSYFDYTTQTTTTGEIKLTSHEITGLESGQEYFFRIKALNDDNKESGWSELSSVVIGKKPAPPTTWSSTTTVISGENLTLYWVHNSEDNSSQTFAEVSLTIGGRNEIHTVENSTNEDDKDKTSFYVVDTSKYPIGTTIEWCVRTAGVTKVYGEWSTKRVVTVYAPPTLELNITDKNGNALSTITTFPFYISMLAGPNTQAPISFHVSIVANNTYDTTDRIGNPTRVKRGDVVYHKQFTPANNIVSKIAIEMSAANVDLQNGIEYTINATVGMNSGLTAEAKCEFSVSWDDLEYVPNAEISIDQDAYTATIRPYCERQVDHLHRVVLVGSHDYRVTVGEITVAEDTRYEIARTSDTDEPVYVGIDENGEYLYYTNRPAPVLVENVLLSVYRREYDGTFTEITSGLNNTTSTYVTDPHPALDYARYRIVATTVETGTVSYYDMPAYPVNGKSIIIQWDEDWDNFDTSEASSMIEQPWAGSLLKLPYNVDVSEAPKKDVSLIKYAGRTNPVSYYGTHLDTNPSWNATIDKNDKETIYALRRLAIWKGDVYVREPSGVGYWATINVSFSQKHCDPAVPVTLDITRVEGGM